MLASPSLVISIMSLLDVCTTERKLEMLPHFSSHGILVASIEDILDNFTDLISFTPPKNEPPAHTAPAAGERPCTMTGYTEGPATPQSATSIQFRKIVQHCSHNKCPMNV